jgi:hypothetical protein
MNREERLLACKKELKMVMERLKNIGKAKAEYLSIQRGEVRGGTHSRKTKKEIEDLTKMETSLLAAESRLTLQIEELS